MDTTNEIQKTIRGLNDEQLAEIENKVREAREEKRAKLTLAEIKPGMTPSERARVQAEIGRVLASL
jgi:hypothetical protein